MFIQILKLIPRIEFEVFYELYEKVAARQPPCVRIVVASIISTNLGRR